jgi:arylsulfatase A-like enzyme
VRTDPSPVRLRPCLLALLALAPTACRESVEPTWRLLATGAEPRVAPLGGDGWRVEPAGRPGAAWVELAFGPEDWAPGRLPGSHEAALPLPGAIGRPDTGAPRNLVVDGEVLEDHSDHLDVATLGSLGPGFAIFAERLIVRLDGGRAPGHATLRVFVDGGHRDDDGAWRLRWNRFAGTGIPLWPGGRTTLAANASAGTMLRFGTAVRTPLATGRWTFRVRADGETLVEIPVELSAPWTIAWHELRLERDVHTLELGVDGPLALTAFVAPTLGPVEVGTPGRRPWASRPDAVLLIADTFRADNLAVHGAPPEWTPNLNALAERSKVFRRAWSASTWTLPSHASMFTGLTPPQHGATDSKHALAGSLETLAERYHSAGYRTVAVTDAVYVSSDYGLDQGFECFDELWGEPDTLLERLEPYLAADDGRPLFLVVHSYRAHSPYLASPAARAELGDLAPEETFDALMRALDQESSAWEHGQPRPASLQRAADRLYRLYRLGCHDLDRLMGTVLERVGTAGLLEHGVLAFTSDHGEAFGEHELLFHGNSMFEEQVAVPLMLHGAGITPEVSDAQVSLLDLARTLAAATGLEPSPSWGGESLLDTRPPRPVMAFGSYESRRPLEAALRAEGRKVVVELGETGTEPRLRFAFDLASDPREEHDRAQEDWAPALLEQLGGRLLDGLAPRAAPSPALLDARELRRLKALGYVE